MTIFFLDSTFIDEQESSHSVVADVLDWNVIANSFWTHTLGKVIESFYSSGYGVISTTTILL